ncbi:MAG: hypothetical protein M1830_007412, partial [Pleopsidium flavum]
MRSQIAQRLRSSSLSSVPPPQTSPEYSTTLERLAIRVLYRSPLPSQNDLPVFILNAAAFPDPKDIDYDALLPYVLARLPGEDELIGGQGYEIVFFAGGGGDGVTAIKKGRPGLGWFLQAYHLLTRATRKRLQKLYIVHEKSWIRVLVEMFSTIVSPKFRKKIVHVSTLTGLALHVPIEDLMIPPSAYLCDRRVSPEIHAPYASGRRAFAIKQPLPLSSNGGHRLPRVLREATSFILMDENIKTEGLFRIPPSAVTVDILREAYDRGQKFIVWHERDVVVIFYRSERRQVLSDSMGQTEGYGVHAAAGLIKLWYRELRHPIIPQTSYRQLHDLFGDPETPIDRTRLIELVSIDSEWSLLTETSRLILTKHLLPLLSRVAAFKDWNQMTSFNLATCLAPSMLCGPDPVEDAKMASIVSRILEAAVANWKTTLAPICLMDYNTFEDSLRMPSAMEDYEDPLDEDPASTAMRTSQTEPLHAQIYGITLVDNDNDNDND